MANPSPHLQELFYKPAKSFVEVSRGGSQQTLEERASEFLCQRTVFILSPDLIGFEYAIYDD